MEIISRGHDIGWACEILESVFVFMQQCFFFETTWEVGSRQCFLVASPSWRGAPSGQNFRATEHFLSLDQLTHEMTPISHCPWRACDCSDPWFLPVIGGIIQLDSRRIFFFSIFFSFSHFLTEFLPRQTGTNQHHWESMRWSPVPSLYPSYTSYPSVSLISVYT